MATDIERRGRRKRRLLLLGVLAGANGLLIWSACSDAGRAADKAAQPIAACPGSPLSAAQPGTAREPVEELAIDVSSSTASRALRAQYRQAALGVVARA